MFSVMATGQCFKHYLITKVGKSASFDVTCDIFFYSCGTILFCGLEQMTDTDFVQKMDRGDTADILKVSRKQEYKISCRNVDTHGNTTSFKTFK